MIEPITPQQYSNNLAIIALKAVNHLAITLNECYGKFWNRDTSEILESLNDNIPLALKRFEANTTIGKLLNQQLEDAGSDLKVIVTMPEGYAFENGKFTYTAPVVIVEEPIIEESPAL